MARVPIDTPKWRRYLRFWRADVAGDVDDELRFHFETRLEELAARGVSEDDARAQALSEFGDPQAVRERLNAMARRAPAGRPLRPARDATSAVVRGRRCGDARPRHRRERGDLLGRQRRAPAAAA